MKKDEMNSLISVIIPIYKVEKYISRCVNSVLMQTYEKLEIILIDDGSPDNCPAICDEYAKKDDRIIVIHKENGGLSSARNAGLDVATGDYVFFLDSDDYIKENAIERLYLAIVNESADIAICNFAKVDDKGEIAGKNISPIKDECIDREGLFQKLTGIANLYYVVAWNKLYKKYLFDNIRFPVGKIHEDEFIVHRIFSKCNKAISLSDKLYCYFSNESSIMRSKVTVKRLDYIEALSDRCKFLYEQSIFECLNKTFNKLYIWYFTEFRPLFKKENGSLIKKYDRLFKVTYRYCHKKLNKKLRLYGKFPRLMILINNYRAKIRVLSSKKS